MKPDEISDRERENSPDTFLPGAFETKETLEHLVACRQALQDLKIDRLKAEAAMLTKQLERIRTACAIEEVSCFRDIQTLQKRLNQHHDHS
jgi:predicted RNase H-like nuclease (RuvC/YqgF family)